MEVKLGLSRQGKNVDVYWECVEKRELWRKSTNKKGRWRSQWI